LVSSVSGLQAHLGFWLRYVSNHVSHAFARRLEGEDVTVAEWVVIRALYDEDAMAPSRLAEDLGLTRGAVTKLADRLIAKALVLRKADPGDGRAQTLALTRGGRKLVPRLAGLADANDQVFFGHLTSTERKALERILKAIVERQGLTALPLG
jgi:DNA-binding MarR family transcriptional regulator